MELYNVESQFDLDDRDHKELLLVALNMLVCRPVLPAEGSARDGISSLLSHSPSELCIFMDDWIAWEHFIANMIKQLERNDETERQ